MKGSNLIRRGICQCGCGGHTVRFAETNEYCGQIKGKFPRFIHGHNGRVMSEETKRKISQTRTGHITTRETRRKIGIANTGHITSEETKRKIGDGNRGKIVPKEVVDRISKTLTGKCKSKEHCKNIGIASSKRWEDPEYRERLLLGLVKGRKNSHMLPNRQENFIYFLLNKMYPKEWKYTGDFSTIINGKNPDFINVNGQKKIIEYNGTHWHQNDIPGRREAVFAEHGYDTLVIWDKELKDIDRVKFRINKFQRKENPYSIHK